MSNITTSQTVFLYTTLYGGVQPYDQCARWSGGWTSNSGVTGSLSVTTAPFAGVNTPYILSTNTPCAIPGTDGGSLTGTLIPNGFTGAVGVWVDAADSEGIFAESNHRSYTVVPEYAFVVNAGPDQTGTLSTYTLAGSIGGGTPPYFPTWTCISQPAGSALVDFLPSFNATGPTVTDLTTDGTYTFRLNANDSDTPAPNYGMDTMNIQVSGQSPATIPFSINWFNQIGSSVLLKSSILTIWHQPTGSVTWNQIITNTATTTTGFTGTVVLDLVDPYTDQIKVNVKGTNNYKSYEIWGVSGIGDELDSQINVYAPSGGITGIVSVNSTSYDWYNVYGWTDSTTCLGIGSLIKMADGSEIKVEDLRIGDSIASLDIKNSDTWNNYTSLEFTPDPISTTVSYIQSFKHNAYVRINDDFNVSESHPLFVFRDNAYKFIAANRLLLTDKLIAENGELIDITSVNGINEPLVVYLVSTDPSRIYIANGVVNHNKRAPIAPSTGLT